jgi:hypothetical protein
MSTRFLLTAALMLAASSSFAKSSIEAVPMDPAEFVAMRADIEDQIRKSAAFREMDINERKEVARALDRMEKVLSGVAAVDELDPPVQTQLFNDQELVNHVLTKGQADDKVICERTRRVGSNLYSNTCLTVGERRRSKESVEQELQRLPRSFPAEVK